MNPRRRLMWVEPINDLADFVGDQPSTAEFAAYSMALEQFILANYEANVLWVRSVNARFANLNNGNEQRWIDVMPSVFTAAMLEHATVHNGVRKGQEASASCPFSFACSMGIRCLLHNALE